MSHRTLLLAALSLGTVFAATQPSQTEEASVVLENGQGQTVGHVKLIQTNDGVLLQADLENLPPGRHAIHIHETGACTAPDFKSAGGHFNPTGASHGYLDGEHHHAGDMPNFEVPANGKVHLEILDSAVTLRAGQPASLRKDGGTAIVIHAGTDDYRSQPSGDAGGRIACGLVQ